MRLLGLRTLLVLVAAAGVAGCGADATASNAYVDDVQRAQATFVSRFDQALSRLTPTSTLAQDRGALGEFAQVTGRFATSLGRIGPPAAVVKQHRALVAVVVAFQRQLQRAQAQLRRGSAADRAAVRTRLSSSVGDTQSAVSKAIADINQALHS